MDPLNHSNDSYFKILQEVKTVAIASGRNPKEITVVAVSKGHSWKEASIIYQQGCRQFGENRIQEALPKQVEAPNDVQWHMIGTLQKNKIKKVVGKFILIHSVDSIELAKKISECSQETDCVTKILLEVNTSKEESKHGFSSKGCCKAFDEIMNLPALDVQGLMTMAPFVEDENVIRNCFSELRKLRDELGLVHLSMGMSHDYRIAIQEGATLLRIGRALFEGGAKKKVTS